MWISTFLFTLSGLVPPSAPSARHEEPPAVVPAATHDGFRDLVLTDALEAARSERKVVMIDFFTTWCGPCKRLDRDTWPNEQVRTWMRDNVIALKVDAELDLPLARRFNIRSYPTIQFLSADALPIAELHGYLPPREFVQRARAALERADALARADREIQGFEEEPLRRLNAGKACAVRAEHEAALGHYMWCWDNALDFDPRFAPVRVTFLLTDVRALGAQFPAANATLLERAQKAADRIVAGHVLDTLLQDCVAIHLGFGDATPLLALSDRLRGEDPARNAMRKKLSVHTLEPLVEARRYADVFEFGFVPQEEFAKLVQRNETRRRKLMPEGQSGTALPASLAKLGARTRSTGAFSVEASLATGRRDVASALIDQLLAFEPRVETYELLLQRVKRVPDDETARAIVARADASTLSDADKLRVRSAAQ
ncbi:MAG: thioredoxin family protein [Planctomycetota bacterium]